MLRNKRAHQKMYARMVREAYMAVEHEWDMDARLNPNVELGSDLTASAFFVVEDTLQLVSNVVGYNPATCKSWFYNNFAFESLEEFEEYIEDVKNLLPDGTEVVKERREGEATTLGVAPEVHVIFKLKIE